VDSGTETITTRWSSLDAGSVAPLTANDFVAFFEGTFSFAILALPFQLSGLLLHVIIP
jgi:hypothetical protein